MIFDIFVFPDLPRHTFRHCFYSGWRSTTYASRSRCTFVCCGEKGSRPEACEMWSLISIFHKTERRRNRPGSQILVQKPWMWLRT